ncbi:unnamed protein product [Notodromas monacha]|uniref:Uncharacterized protein n=1 Tax=Notodromas monacha TaxID=399045 RepID=A0A7R9BNK3_9CRUS|nr:unnamed protein product [Notodromas monacha]CAG0918777.1 unnamed protein product [Notodromas monacha]
MSLFPAYGDNSSFNPYEELEPVTKRTVTEDEKVSRPVFSDSDVEVLSDRESNRSRSRSRQRRRRSTSSASTGSRRRAKRKKEKKKKKLKKERRRERNASPEPTVPADFTIDARPDSTLLSRGVPYPHQVPKYNKKLCRRLAFPDVRRFFHLRRLKAAGSSRFFDVKVPKRSVRFLTVRFRPIASFIPLPTEQNETPKVAYTIVSSTDPLGIYDKGTAAYAKGVAKEHEEDVRVIERSEVRERVKELNKLVNDNPKDVQSWLRLVDLQDSVVREEFNVNNIKANERTVAEKKAAVLDKALTKLPTNMDLVLARLEVAKTVSNSVELRKEWGYVNFRHPADCCLWRETLVFSQTHLGYFNVLNTARDYKESLGKLRLILDGVMLSHKSGEGFDVDVVDIVSWFAHFWASTGFYERGIAVFQAACEFNLFCPEELTKHEDKVNVFEVFWDSRAPRIGERDARGWSTSLADKRVFLLETGRDRDFEDLEDKLASKEGATKAERWLSIENARCEWQFLPWAPSEDNEDVEDRDRVVLFEHISPSLLTFSSISAKFHLFATFLTFLGSRIPGITYGARLMLGISDPCVETFVDARTDDLFETFLPYRPSSDLSTFRDFASRVMETGLKVFDGFERRMLVHWNLLANIDRLTDETAIAKRIKSAMKENRTDMDLFRLYGEKLWDAGKKKDAENVFQTALEVSPREGERGSDASKFLEQNVALLNLGFAYVKKLAGLGSHLTESEKQTALWVLFQVSDGCRTFSGRKQGSEVTDAMLLRARANFSETQAALLKPPFGISRVTVVPTVSSTVDLLAAWTSSNAWMEYLSSGNVSHARIILQNAIRAVKMFVGDSLESQGKQRQSKRPSVVMCGSIVTLERLHAELVELMFVDMRSGGTVPRTVVKVLRCALEDVPASSLILSNFWAKQLNPVLRKELTSHVMRTLPDAGNDLLLILASVKSELERYRGFNEDDEVYVSPIVGTGNRILSLLEKALSGRRLQHCALLWRLRMRILHMLGKSAEVKAVFYLAVEQVPYCKSVYLDVVQYCQEMLKEVVDLMQEKLMRVRLPLEELDVLCEDLEEELDAKNDEESDSKQENDEAPLEPKAEPAAFD